MFPSRFWVVLQPITGGTFHRLEKKKDRIGEDRILQNNKILIPQNLKKQKLNKIE